MTQIPPPFPPALPPPPPPPSAPALPPPRLGVIDAMSLGWQLVKSDFWLLWIIALVAMVMQALSGPGAIVVAPVTMAGLFYVLMRRMDGHKVEFVELFEGFRQRFVPSFVAGLIPVAAQILPILIWLPMHLTIVFGSMAVIGHRPGPEAPLVIMPLFCLEWVVLCVLILVSLVVYMFFIFAQCAVWDLPQSGWEAAKRSARMVRSHLASVVGLMVLFWLAGMGFAFVGYCTLCIGFIFLMPLWHIWYAATVLYLYRSWKQEELAAPATPPAVQAG